MKEIPGFVIRGAPRTKKNSSDIISIPKKGSSRCGACGHRPGFPKIMPSKAYRQWEGAALVQVVDIKRKLRALGVEFPILGPVSVEALFYRERNDGDSCGYYQSVGDMLQAAEIIADDRQIEDWDGSRRLKSADNPRVEIFITCLGEPARQLELTSETDCAKPKGAA